MSVAEITVEGLNRAAFFNKLRRAGIKVVGCTETTGENNKKMLLIAVKASDAEKVFAISKKLWYTKLKGYKGFFGLLRFLSRNIAVCLCCAALFFSSFLLGNVCLLADASSFPERTAEKIVTVLKNNGYSRPLFLHGTDFEKIERTILENVEEVKSVSVKREGMRLVVYGVSEPPHSAAYRKTDVLRSVYTGTLERFVVFSGEKLKNEGDEVVAGEIIAKNGVIAFYSVACEFTFSRLGDGSDEFFRDTSDAVFLLYPTAKITDEKKESFGGKTKYTLTLKVVLSYPNED